MANTYPVRDMSPALRRRSPSGRSRQPAFNVDLDATPNFLLNLVDSEEPSDSNFDSDYSENYPPPHLVHARNPFIDDEAEEVDDDSDSD